MDSQKPTSRVPSEIKATVYQTSTRHHPALQFSHPLPYGAILHDGGVQFVVFSRSATAMRVLLYDKVDDREPTEIIRLRSRYRSLGRYLEHFRARDRRPASSITCRPTAPSIRSSGQRFDGQARLIDPYAKALAGDFLPTRRRHHSAAQVRGHRRPVRLARRSPPAADLCPRRSSTKCTSAASPAIATSGVEHPGTYSGRDRKDSLFEIAGRDGRRVDAGPRVSHRIALGARNWNGPTTGATIRWRSSRRTAAMPRPASRAARCANSSRWCRPCTRRASK